MSFDFNQSYFELFGLPETLDVDVSQISQRYRELQKQYHPDRYADQSQQAQRMAIQAASYVNMAFETLKSPLLLASYQLERHGIDLKSETDTRMNGAFLMKQMEWRESLDETKHQNDPWAHLDHLSQEVKQARQGNIQRLSEQLEQQQWNEARDSVRELQFIEKMQSEIGLKEEALDELN